MFWRVQGCAGHRQIVTMDKTILPKLCPEHEGKLSDRWAPYLRAHDAAFAPCRDRLIRSLGIGIDNFGLLKAWGNYFASATLLVGRTIASRCSHFVCDDPRISVVMGGANSNEGDAYIKAVRPRSSGCSPIFTRHSEGFRPCKRL